MNNADDKKRLLEDFIGGAKVDTRSKILARGTLSPDRHPTHMTVRIPEKYKTFFDERVTCNKSLALTAILDHVLDEVEKKLLDGDFNIREWLHKD